MSEEHKKNLKLLAYWLFGTVVIVFGAITAYILFVGRVTAGISVMTAIASGFPIWGIVALAAIVIYAGYYFYVSRKG